MMSEIVWVLLRDTDYEGCSPPVAAWKTKPTVDQLALWFTKEYGEIPDSVYLNNILNNRNRDWTLDSVALEE